MRAIDLFAGPGGWDEGLRDLGIAPLGIEWDDGACATRRAAGHETLQADVSELNPSDFAPCDLLLASPPCQAFSAAGKGGGHHDVPIIEEAVWAIVNEVEGWRETLAPQLVDERSLLVVEPLRWALALEPNFVACEQVPPVLPLWERFASVLLFRGWSVWTGTLTAEQYGVPQTRLRAFLIASRANQARPPKPTHQRYMGMPKEREEDRLFDAGERTRIVAKGEENLLPWISMADALGWGMTERPTTTVVTIPLRGVV